MTDGFEASYPYQRERQAVDEARYNKLWRSARLSLLSGDLRLDGFPADGDPRWGLSLVVIPDVLIGARLAAQVGDLRSAYRGRHHLYDAPDLHMTITSLEPYRDRIDPRIVAYYMSSVEAAGDLLDFRVDLAGLGGSDAGAFVQGFDAGTLQPIREWMREAAARLHDGEAPPMSFVRDTAHISLSVHKERIAEPGVVQLIDRRRTESFGTIDGAHVALVEYRARRGTMRMMTLERFR